MKLKRSIKKFKLETNKKYKRKEDQEVYYLIKNIALKTGTVVVKKVQICQKSTNWTKKVQIRQKKVQV